MREGTVSECNAGDDDGPFPDIGGRPQYKEGQGEGAAAAHPSPATTAIVAATDKGQRRGDARNKALGIKQGRYSDGGEGALKGVGAGGCAALPHHCLGIHERGHQ